MSPISLPSRERLPVAKTPPHGHLVRRVGRLGRTNLRLGDPKLSRLVRAAADALYSR